MEDYGENPLKSPIPESPLKYYDNDESLPDQNPPPKSHFNIISDAFEIQPQGRVVASPMKIEENDDFPKPVSKTGKARIYNQTLNEKDSGKFQYYQSINESDGQNQNQPNFTHFQNTENKNNQISKIDQQNMQISNKRYHEKHAYYANDT